MAVIKCKMCGGNLNISEGSTIAECEFCGTRQTVPTVDNEKKLTLFSRANRLRLACEFDKAAGVYENIVAEFPLEAEAYWGLVLCRYGIEYVDDPVNGKKIPTCRRSSFLSVLDDSDFDQACENADAAARKVYREEGKKIEELRRGILEVSGKEDPYDIFICYKETGEDGRRTIDSVIAEDVYNALTEKGYRVFFSRISLEDKLGTEYEPCIFAALNSAKVMLVFGTDYEHFNAVWVKNEWSRFLALISAGQKKTLIPCYEDIDACDMPREFAKLQAQDMGKVGALQDLLRGIGKIAAPGNIKQPADENSGVAPLLDRGHMALEDKDWEKAKDYFEKALNINARCADAYFGLVLGELETDSWDAFTGKYMESPFSISDNKNLRRARQFAEGELKERFSQLDARAETNEIQITEAWKKEEGELIARAEVLTGPHSPIVAEESKSVETKIEIVHGMQFYFGLVSPYFTTDDKQKEAVVYDARILITDRKISFIADILPLLEQIVQSGSQLVILAKDIDGEALSTLIINHLRGTLNVVCIGTGDAGGEELLRDIAALTGGQAITESLYADLREVDISQLGRAQQVRVTKEYTTIIGGAGKTEAIRERAEEIRSQIEDFVADYDKEPVIKRLEQLADGMAVIRIGGDSEDEITSKLNHMKAALKARREKLDGITPLTEEKRTEEWKKEQERLISKAIEDAGAARFIAVEESKRYDSCIKVCYGMRLNQGYLSPYLVMDSEKMESILYDAYLFITDNEITLIEEILPILEQIVQNGSPLVIFAENFGDEVLNTLIVNNQRGTFRAQCVKTSEWGGRRREILEDIAIATGGMLITSVPDNMDNETRLKYLGKARTVIINKTTTSIIDGYAGEPQLTNRIQQIREQILHTTDEEYRIQLHERLERLLCGVVVVTVGGDTETETERRKHDTEEQLKLRLSQTDTLHRESLAGKRRMEEMQWAEAKKAEC